MLPTTPAEKAQASLGKARKASLKRPGGILTAKVLHTGPGHQCRQNCRQLWGTYKYAVSAKLFSYGVVTSKAEQQLPIR